MSDLDRWINAWEDATPTERAIGLDIMARMARGRGQYGPWDLDRDERDLVEEAREEGLDLVVYLTAMQQRRRR